MYRLQLINGLLYANIVITHHGEKIIINDVIIDTGAK